MTLLNLFRKAKEKSEGVAKTKIMHPKAEKQRGRPIFSIYIYIYMVTNLRTRQFFESASGGLRQLRFIIAGEHRRYSVVGK